MKKGEINLFTLIAIFTSIVLFFYFIYLFTVGIF